MSDIVKRGRDSITTCYVEKINPHDLCDELADEIERLRERFDRSEDLRVDQRKTYRAYVAAREKVVEAVRKLKWYQYVGGPNYTEWDVYLNNLFAALHDLDEQGGDDE